MTLPELHEAVDQFKKHLLFLKDMDMCTDDEKNDIVHDIKNMFSEITRRTSSTIDNIHVSSLLYASIL